MKKNIVKIKKPVMDIDGTQVLMDRHWYNHIRKHLDEISLELPIKEIYDSEKHLLVEFKNAKIATVFRLKYGERLE
jgi:uncharacterized protein YeaO (DUF488 family)